MSKNSSNSFTLDIRNSSVDDLQNMRYSAFMLCEEFKVKKLPPPDFTVGFLDKNGNIQQYDLLMPQEEWDLLIQGVE